MSEVRVKRIHRIQIGLWIIVAGVLLLGSLIAIFIRQSQRQALLQHPIQETCSVVAKRLLKTKSGGVERDLQCPGPVALRTEQVPEAQIEHPMVGETISVYYAKANPHVWLSVAPTRSWDAGESVKEWLCFLLAIGIAAFMVGQRVLPVVVELNQLRAKNFYPAKVRKVEPAEAVDWIWVWIAFEHKETKYVAKLMVKPGKSKRYRPGNTVYFVFENEDEVIVRLVNKGDLESESARVILPDATS